MADSVVSIAGADGLPKHTSQQRDLYRGGEGQTLAIGTTAVG